MRPIEAHYENGLLRPSAPLALRPGERVALVVMRHADPSRWDMARLAGVVDEDEALAGTGLGEWTDALDREDQRGEVWWAEIGAHRPQEQTGRRPVVVWQSDALTRVLRSVLVIPLTTNQDRAHLAGTATIAATDAGPPQDSVALAFQLRSIPKSALVDLIRPLTSGEIAELELATDEALGRVEPE
jgi:mRNA-degrading endonuclease toxin of MazEF toxin-antitoxin module/predicted DNA-binding antitoxin AbrB/MazE fold protein